MFARDPTTATIGNEILPFELEHLPEFFQKKGEVEINYTEKNREESLRELRKALASDDVTKEYRIADEFLLMFLNSRKYDIDRTLVQVKKTIKFRRENIEMFENIKFEALLKILSSQYVTFLPWRCHEGCGILFVDLGNFNSEMHPLPAVKQMFFTLLLQGLRYPMTQVNGYKVIFSLGNIPSSAIRLCSPRNLYLFYYGTQEICPARYKGFHIINMGALGRLFLQMTSALLPKKLKERIHVHATIDSLLKYFPKAVIPVKYGGDLKDYDMTDWLRKMTSPEEVSVLNINPI